MGARSAVGDQNGRERRGAIQSDFLSQRLGLAARQRDNWAIITLTKVTLNVESPARDRPDDEIKITSAMIEAGEAVLDRACDRAEVPASWSLLSAAKDVYIAMENVRCCQVSSGRKSYSAARAQGADNSNGR
jgi:hypothetical protein